MGDFLFITNEGNEGMDGWMDGYQKSITRQILTKEKEKNELSHLSFFFFFLFHFQHQSSVL